MTRREPLRTVGLFAGIGGIELGLQKAGFEAALLCEIDCAAQAVLKARFEGVRIQPDIRELEVLPRADVLSAGFPCQDLSQAGRTAGISGRQSGLVDHVFRLMTPADAPAWLLLENVPFMLQLDGGKAMEYLTTRLERLEYNWAYRVVNTQAFGLPQRRHRVILVASRTHDPRSVLFEGDESEPEVDDSADAPRGFYWTEGNRGLGWAIDAVPTLKGGSTVGIPSPPAIWFPREDRIITPSIRDTERLQGFPVDWTLPAVEIGKFRPGYRWKLVGNAVSVPVAEWIGRQLHKPGKYEEKWTSLLEKHARWPSAAWGFAGERRRVDSSLWPVQTPYQHLRTFLTEEGAPLSARATAGFLGRACASTLRFERPFLPAVERHLKRQEGAVRAVG